MAIRFSTGLKNAMLGDTGLKSALADGVIHIYSGAQPSSANDAATGTLLGTVTVDAGAFTPGVATNGLEFEAASGGSISKAAAENWQFSGITNGTAGWFRFVGNAVDSGAQSTTLPRIDGSIARTGGDMTLSSTTITAGAPNTIDVFQLSMGNN